MNYVLCNLNQGQQCALQNKTGVNYVLCNLNQGQQCTLQNKIRLYNALKTKFVKTVHFVQENLSENAKLN